ncbi:MAG: hypothetical protein C5B48_00520 [Candidatus Rokuibacteriota bacterium]|nr:MAG: hypothetical protein C5B48_00520 [Candidatus Rokubacteria bacterium]
MRPSAHRWLIVAALFTVTYAVSTPLAAYGVFLPVLADTFAWSRGSLATALSINLLVGGLATLPIGALAGRYGPRVVLVLTAPLTGAGFALVSTIAARWQLYLFVGVLGGIGMSSFYLLGTSTVAHWFHERRGLAIALVLVGFNLGYMTGGPVAAWLIATVGWRAAYALLGGCSGALAVVVPLTVRLPSAAEGAALRAAAHREAPGSAGRVIALHPVAELGVTFSDALLDPRQWYLNMSWLLLGALTLMVSVHIVPFARDRGIDLAGASLALTAYGVGSVTGRIAGGAACDRFGAAPTIRVAYTVEALGLLALWWLPSRGALLGCLAAFGMGFAASDTIVVKAVPDVFGVGAMRVMMSVLSLGWRLGAALGPAVAGFLYDVTGSYAIPFGASPLVVLASWALFARATSSRYRQRWPGHSHTGSRRVDAAAPVLDGDD